MFLTDEKLKKTVNEIKEYRYRDIIHLDSFAMREDNEGVANPAVPTDFTGWDTLKAGGYWSGRDRYLWMHREVAFPEEWRGKKILGLFDFGKTGRGNISGFEAMLYVNGEMYQGVDANHREVFFDSSLCGVALSLTFRLWSGLEGGGVPREQEHRISRADIAWLDEQTDDLYYMGAMILDTIDTLDDNDPVKYDLRNALNEACNLIDWAYPGSEAFYESVHRADELVNEKINAMEKHPAVSVKCVGHTHIDVAWLWTLKHVREKCSRSFSTVLRLMEQYPEYIFLQSQPRLYEYMKEEFPDLYEKIKKRVAEGRWEADGGMWVEADCNLTSGESLTRQILLGNKFFKEEFGHEAEYLWLPDVFGYSWALPQILKKSGIHTFMTTKLGWNQYNRIPHDTFVWRGIDGSEVLAHFITTPDPGDEPESWNTTYNGNVLPCTAKGAWNSYREKGINREILIAYGYGDGGGGANRDMLEQIRRMDRIPGNPKVEQGKAGEFFRDLHERLDYTDQYVPAWDGELYFERHRGTYTSQAYNKRMNRKMELLYRKVEWMTVMDALYQGRLGKARQEKLTEGWKYILTEQFHDIIPGSSIREVYEDSRKNYGYAEQIARQVEEEFREHVLAEKEDTYTIFNASGWTRDGIAAIPGSRCGVYKDEDGNTLRAQRSGEETFVEVKNVPAMGYRVITFEAAADKEEKGPFIVDGREIDTPYYRISLNDCGQIIGLYDKTFQREVIPEGERGNVLQLFEDKPLDFDAWDVDIFYQQKMREITELTEFEVKEQGELRLVIRMKWHYMNSEICQDMILYSGDRRIDFQTTVDNHERQRLLKAAFPVDIRSTYGTYDIQYGNVRRSNHWNTSWDYARFETVAHRWADLSERGYGVSILNDCKYGHDIKDNVIRITLLKSAVYPDYLADQGIHRFTYSLLPHGGDFVEGRTVQEAFDLNEPMQVMKGQPKLEYRSFLAFDNDQIEVDAVKKSEDGRHLVIRFHEFAGSKQKVTVKPGFEYKKWAEGDLKEGVIGEVREAGEEISVVLTPYEIKTLLFAVE